MQQIEEHRRRAKHTQHAHPRRRLRALNQHQQAQAQAQRQQQEHQGRRVLGDVHEAHHGMQQVGLHGPLLGLAIAVDRPQHHEADQGRDTGRPQPTLPCGRRHLGLEPRPHRVAQRNHADPGQQGIRGAQTQGLAHVDPAPVMQHGPRHMHELADREVHAVQRVVTRHQHHAHRHQGRARQPQQRGQGQHAQADHPDHLQVDDRRRELERPGEVDYQHFQQHQEQPTLGQERGRGAPVAGLGAV
ncbi:hypothetical protein D3C77_528950 [compost metagenome]